MLDLLVLGALNHLLAAAPWARRRLAPFAGRRARIALSAPAGAITLRIAADGTCESLGNAAPDVEILLPAGALRAAIAGRGSLLRGARISGGADFAEALGDVLRHLDWDAEDDLSRWVGDIAARRLADAARSFLAGHADTVQRLADNLEEFLRHERPPGAKLAAARVRGRPV